MEKESPVYGMYMHQNHEGLRMSFRECAQVVESTVSSRPNKHVVQVSNWGEYTRCSLTSTVSSVWTEAHFVPSSFR